MKAAAPAQAGALAKAWPPLSIEKHLGGDDNQPLVWMLEWRSRHRAGIRRPASAKDRRQPAPEPRRLPL